MELPISPLFVYLFLALLFIQLLRVVAKPKSQSIERSCRVPSPWKLPFIGHLHHLALGGRVQHRTLRDLARRHGPLLHLHLGEVDHYVVSSPELARELLTTHDIAFASRPALAATTIILYGNTAIAFSPYGPYWRQLRKICVVELFSTKRVRGFAAMREEEIAKVLRGISSSASRVNISEWVYALAYAITLRVEFGAVCRHLGRFEAAAKRVIKVASGFAVADLFPSLGFLGTLTGMSAEIERAHRELDEILEEIIEEHEEKRERAKKKKKKGKEEKEEEGEEDLLDVLLRLKEEGVIFDSKTPPLTRENVKAVITEMFIAGTDTTATTLAWAMSELLRHPDAMAKAQSELRRSLRGGAAQLRDEDVASLRYTKLVVKETLRLHPPLPLLLPRLAREPRRVGGHDSGEPRPGERVPEQRGRTALQRGRTPHGSAAARAPRSLRPARPRCGRPRPPRCCPRAPHPAARPLPCGRPWLLSPRASGGAALAPVPNRRPSSRFVLGRPLWLPSGIGAPPPRASNPAAPTKRPSLSWPHPKATSRTGSELRA